LRTRSFFPFVKSISQQQSSSFAFDTRRTIRSRGYFYTITTTNTITIIESAELAPQLQRRYKSNDAKENRQNKKQQQQQQEEENKQNDILQFLNVSPATKNQIQAIWTQSQSLPNQITIARILSTPLLCHFIMSNQYKLAVVGCILAGASDVLDGYIARNYNQKTILGTYLDPLADKIFINGIALSLSYSDILPLWCTSLWLGRDVILIGMAYRMAAVATQGSGNNVADPASTPLKIQPMMISKVNTLFQFGTIWTGLGCVALGYQDVLFSSAMAVVMMGEEWSLSPMDGLCFVTCGTTIMSGLGYMDGKSMKKRKDMKS
jgi:cardiolipin synthase